MYPLNRFVLGFTSRAEAPTHLFGSLLLVWITITSPMHTLNYLLILLLLLRRHPNRFCPSNYDGLASWTGWQASGNTTKHIYNINSLFHDLYQENRSKRTGARGWGIWRTGWESSGYCTFFYAHKKYPSGLGSAKLCVPPLDTSS